MESKTTPIPMARPDLTGAEIEAVNQVLHTAYLSFGPRLSAFEEAVAEYVGVRHAVGVNSGTSGLHLCAIAAGIQEGDLVITTPFSFIASANCILYQRAVPIFVDIDPATGNLDAGLLAEAAWTIGCGPGTAERWLPPALRRSWQMGVRGRLKAILPVHVYGQPAEMDAIAEVARLCDLRVIEDACEAIGAQFKGRQVGTLSDAAVFAF